MTIRARCAVRRLKTHFPGRACGLPRIVAVPASGASFLFAFFLLLFQDGVLLKQGLPGGYSAILVTVEWYRAISYSDIRGRRAFVKVSHCSGAWMGSVRIGGVLG